MGRANLQFSLGGVSLQLVPSFENLAKLETGLNMSCVTLLGKCSSDSFDLQIGHLAKAIFLTARPVVDQQLPKWWTIAGVGQQLLDSGVRTYIPILTSFLMAALTAAPEEDNATGAGEQSSLVKP